MVFFFPAGLLLLIGWLIKYKKATWLISGYNTSSREEKQKYDVEKLCKYMGNFLFSLSSLLIIMAIAVSLASNYENEITTFGFVVFVITLIIGIIYLNTGNRLKK